MALASVAANSLDHIKGALLQFDYGRANGSSAPTDGFTFGGWIDSDFEIEPILERTMIEPGNCLYPTDGFITRSGWKIRGTLMEAALDKLLVVCGGQPSSAAWSTPGVGGPEVVSGTATLPLTQIGNQVYWQVRLGVKGQSFKSKLFGTPSGVESTDVYTSRVMTLWRCTFTPRGAIKMSRTEIWKVPFELDCYYDTSVTESATLGALGIIVDTVAAPTLSGL